MDDEKNKVFKNTQHKKFLFASCLITIILGLHGICPRLWLSDGYV